MTFRIHFGRASYRDVPTWPEALACAIEKRTAEIVNPDRVDGADDASWRAQHGLTREQERDLLEAGLI